jgi:hypothetical protein
MSRNDSEPAARPTIKVMRMLQIPLIRVPVKASRLCAPAKRLQDET